MRLHRTDRLPHKSAAPPPEGQRVLRRTAEALSATVRGTTSHTHLPGEMRTWPRQGFHGAMNATIGQFPHGVGRAPVVHCEGILLIFNPHCRVPRQGCSQHLSHAHNRTLSRWQGSPTFPAVQAEITNCRYTNPGAYVFAPARALITQIRMRGVERQGGQCGPRSRVQPGHLRTRLDGRQCAVKIQKQRDGRAGGHATGDFIPTCEQGPHAGVHPTPACSRCGWGSTPVRTAHNSPIKLAAHR